MVEHVGIYNDGGYDSCAIAWPEGGSVDGECYTHAEGDSECRFQIELRLRHEPLFSPEVRKAFAWRFERPDAEPRNGAIRRGYYPRYPYGLRERQVNDFSRSAANGEE